MILLDADRAVLRRIDPLALERLAIERGYRLCFPSFYELGTDNDHSSRWRSYARSEKPTYIVIPFDPNAPDFVARLAEALVDLGLGTVTLSLPHDAVTSLLREAS